MDIGVFLNLFIKYVESFGSVTSFLILATIMLYNYKQNQKDREHSDNKFDEMLENQNEMRKDYKKGFIKVHEDLDKIDSRIESLEGQQAENNLLALRSIIANNSLPEDYRLASYDDYKKKGGNSWVHEYVKEEILNKRIKK